MKKQWYYNTRNSEKLSLQLPSSILKLLIVSIRAAFQISHQRLFVGLWHRSLSGVKSKNILIKDTLYQLQIVTSSRKGLCQATIRMRKVISSLARGLLSLSLKRVFKHPSWHCRPCNDNAKENCQMPGWHNSECGDDGTTNLTTNANHEVVAGACPPCFQPF